MKKKIVAWIKHYPSLQNILLILYILPNKIRNRLHEKPRKIAYYKKIEEIKKSKKIIVDLAFGGIGDCLAYSTLPRLLKETYDIDFYLSEKSLEQLRNPDTLTLCFKLNPYFKSISSEQTTFQVDQFESEKSLYTFLTDQGGETIIEILERQFKVPGNGRPELYYKPNLLAEYKNIVLVDKNMISGQKFGWKYKPNAFETEAAKRTSLEDSVEYVEPSKQTLFEYVDKIYSCKYFIATFSGGASIAACFNKPFSVIWPLNGKNRSNYQFCYTKSQGNYIS